MLIGFGSEKSVSKCGIESFGSGGSGGDGSSVRYNNDVHPMDVVFDKDKEWRTRGDWQSDVYQKLPVGDQVKAAVALLVAAQAGYSAALVPLSTLLSTGIGLVPLMNDLQANTHAGKTSRHILAHILQYIPLPINLALATPDTGDSCDATRSFDCQPASFREGVIIDSKSLLFFPLPLVFRMSRLLRQSSGLSSAASSEPPLSQKQIGFESHKQHYSDEGNKKVFHRKHLEGYDLPLSDSVFSWKSHFSKPDKHHRSNMNLITKLTSGLLLLAALDDHPDAIIALQKRYRSWWLYVVVSNLIN
jgi:hypothetical protein